MARSVSFNASCGTAECFWGVVTKWLSCNGEACGVGPTLVFASAATLFLYHELQVALHEDQTQATALETTLISTMMVGMLSLMVHIWVCTMRFFQYYLDSLIKDSPNVILEMTTVGLLGSKSELVALGPLMRFLRQQQPQIHITVCWFLSLCYADYVRKNYCTRFNMPYLEQWQTELHTRARSGVRSTMLQVNSYIESLHQHLHGYTPPPTTTDRNCTGKSPTPVEISGSGSRAGSRAGSRGSWRLGRLAGRGSDQSCEWRSQDVCVQLLSRSSETTLEAIKKLTAYIAETRCSCSSGAKNGGVASVVTPTRSQHRALPLEDNGSLKKTFDANRQ